MSSHPSSSPPNPYASPIGTVVPARVASPALPVFCLVMFSLSLAFCVLRIPLVLLGGYNWLTMPAEAADMPLYATASFEVLSGLAIVLLGIPASIGMLMKRRWGVVLGTLTFAASVFSLGVAMWQMAVLLQISDDPAQRAGFVIGGLITLLLRCTIVGLYALAVLKLAQWLRGQAANA